MRLAGTPRRKVHSVPLAHEVNRRLSFGAGVRTAEGGREHFDTFN
jgi:hypothetical protein